MPRSTHLVVTGRSREQIEALVPTVKEFLAERGLELNAEKTRIVHVKDGFNFLGFTVRSYKDKCIVKPQKEKMLTFLKGIRRWLKKRSGQSAEVVIQLLNPKLRGWANYYRHVNSKQTFKYVDAQIWRAIWNWCLRRHQNKSKAWVYRKYFKTVGNRTWKFFARTKNLDVGSKDIFLFNLSQTPLRSHIKVKGAASPDDADLRTYWQKRRLGRKRAGLSDDEVTVPWLLGA